MGRAVCRPAAQHLLFGTMFALFALWLVRRDFDTGVSYHFIGMTAVTLLLDWPLAIVAALIAQVGLVALGRQDLAAMGVNGLLLIGLPVLVTEVCAMLVERAQPRNLFVYIFCSGFFCRRVVGTAVPAGEPGRAVAGRALRDARVAVGLYRLPVADHLSRSLHQRHGGQRAGGVLPRVARNLQPDPLPAGPVEG
ncbi:hypothetical protein G3435_19805 [Pseudomonas sp. MAFF212428]|uniref:Uncharacterized protein n=1 Tax=Pseudomonas brassicae TaxID=2708063 RepID=A0A6M0D121_9PSED|nr:hypothetical protein [Pseudomonas brassicae]